MKIPPTVHIGDSVVKTCDLLINDALTRFYCGDNDRPLQFCTRLREQNHDPLTCNRVHKYPDTFRVGDCDIPRAHLVNNKMFPWLMKYPNANGRWCTDVDPSHEASTCRFAHRKPGFTSVNGITWPFTALVKNPARRYLEGNPTNAGKRCTLTAGHDPNKCQYVHFVADKPGVSQQQKPAAATLPQLPSPPSLSSAPSAEHSGKQTVRVGIENVDASAFVPNGQLSLLLARPHLSGKLCRHSNDPSHDPMVCNYLHYRLGTQQQPYPNGTHSAQQSQSAIVPPRTSLPPPPPPPQQYSPQPGPVGVPCPRPGCRCDSFDGRAQVHCCRVCKDGMPCLTRTHLTPSAHATTPAEVHPVLHPPPPLAPPPPLQAPPPPPPGPPPTSHPWQVQPQQAVIPMSSHVTPPHTVRCARPGCPCDSFNANPSEYCCRACRQVQSCRTRVHVYTGAAATAVPYPPQQLHGGHTSAPQPQPTVNATPQQQQQHSHLQQQQQHSHLQQQQHSHLQQQQQHSHLQQQQHAYRQQQQPPSHVGDTHQLAQPNYATAQSMLVSAGIAKTDCCGVKVRPGARFCQVCGQPVK
jgi:hypothetical protein